MATIIPILKKNRNNRENSILLRVTVNRKCSRISIGHKINLKDWDNVNKKVKKSHPNSVRLNNIIQNYISKIDNIILQKEADGEKINFNEIKEKVFNKTITSNTLSEYTNFYLEELLEFKKFSQHGSSVAQVNKLILHFGGDSTFKDITTNNIKKFIGFLKSKHKLSERSIVNHLILLRSLCNKAIRDGLMNTNHYPFGKNGISVKIPQSVKIGLTFEEIKLIENLDIEEDTTKWNAKNAFLLSFYFAGARISDVIRVKWTDIRDERLQYVMGKNNKVSSVKITKKARKILDRYKLLKSKTDIYVLPELNKEENMSDVRIYNIIRFSTKKYNNWLKKIAKEVGITKNVTCHIARHSFGNISGDKIPIQMLQKLYRHSDITTTINYQQSFINKDTDDALEAVIGGSE